MQNFDSVEHAKELDVALQAIVERDISLQPIVEQDSVIEETIRFDKHNVSKKTKGIRSIEKQKPHVQLNKAYADIDKFLNENGQPSSRSSARLN